MLGALASVLSIWVVTGALVYLAAARIVSNDYEIEARAMLATSASAVGVNVVYVSHRAVHTCVPLHTPSLSPGLPSYTPATRVPLVPQDTQPWPPGHLLSLCTSLMSPSAASPLFPYTPGFQPMYIHPLAPHPLTPPSSIPLSPAPLPSLRPGTCPRPESLP